MIPAFITGAIFAAAFIIIPRIALKAIDRLDAERAFEGVEQ